jgi:hypothetical protein
MKKVVPITYDAATDTWDAENPVVVTPGLTVIEWTVQLASPDQGAITFGTEPAFQGIKFNRGWEGTHPVGGADKWETAVADLLKPGDPPRNYHYTVNTMYQSDALLPATKKSWDPDVEEDPKDPPPIKE